MATRQTFPLQSLEFSGRAMCSAVGTDGTTSYRASRLLAKQQMQQCFYNCQTRACPHCLPALNEAVVPRQGPRQENWASAESSCLDHGRG